MTLVLPPELAFAGPGPADVDLSFPFLPFLVSSKRANFAPEGFVSFASDVVVTLLVLEVLEALE